MNTPITPAPPTNLITIRSVTPGIADAASSPGTLKAQIGQLVSGTIFGMDPSGEPLMKSEQGDLALKLPYHLPSGTDVILRMEAAAGGGMRARILSINGQTLQDYTALAQQAPAESALTEDTVSLAPGLARTAQPPASPAQQSQQVAMVPGENNPASAPRAAEMRALLTPDSGAALPLPAALPPVTKLLATLLSRSPELPGLLQSLPPGIALPPRIQSGSSLEIEITQVSTPPEQTPSPAHAQAAPAPATALGFGQMLERMNAVQIAQSRAAPVAPEAPPSPGGTIAPLAQATLQTTLAALSGDALMLPSTAPTPAPPGQHPTFTAQVIAVEPNGEALVHTPLGMVRLPAQSALPLQEGMQLEWRLLGAQPAPQAPLPLPSTGPLGWLPLADRWETLDDVAQLLAASLPMGKSPLARLPQPGPHLGAELLHLLSSLKSGKSTPWIGQEAIDLLNEKQRPDLLQRLKGDFELLAQPLHTPNAPWQALLFPVWAEGQLHQARLFVNQQPPEEKQVQHISRTTDTRFVLELTLSRLGDMQLCGLVRKPEPQNIQFDLIVRCKQELSTAQKKDIAAIFEQGAALTGYRGQLLFQHTPTFPDHPLESFRAATAGVMA